MDDLKATPHHLELYKLQKDLLDDFEKRRGEGYCKDVVFVRRASSRTKPDIFTKRESYSFLQYLRIVMHWAKKSSGLSRPHIELLLYLQPLGIFQKGDFSFFAKVIQVYQHRLFQTFIDEGLIKKWRSAKSNKRQSALYCLTPKADTLCTRIHKMCIGEEQIPESANNPFNKSQRPIDKYYMDIIKKMNEKNKK